MNLKINESFLNPKLSVETLDLYIVRKSILSSINTILPQLHGVLLDVGCGYQPYRTLLTQPPSKVHSYLGLDLTDNLYMKPDIQWDGQSIPLEESSVECALATEVFEHCPEPEIVMKEIYRVLKPNGLLFFTVPFLWNLHNVPYDEYRYTPFALNRHLANSGFVQINIKALGGWDSSLAQMIGLWIRRRFGYTITKLLIRKLLSILLLPLIGLLYKIDNPPSEFNDGQMITGLWGTAIKSG